jgi:hypothetical protein
MTLCTTIDTLAMAYLDDELAEEELRELELHLRDCAACRGRVDAEREELATLRAQLAPPPMPDVVRARLAAVLDAEDSAQRSSRVWQWILPGAATVAAVAALALFVLLPAQPETPAAAKVARLQMQAAQVPQVRVSPVSDDGQLAASGRDISVELVARGNARWEGREVINHIFNVRVDGERAGVIQLSLLDARGMSLSEGQLVQVDGLDLRVVSTTEGYIVATRRGSLGFVFTSTLPVRDLIETIVRYDLVRPSADF